MKKIAIILLIVTLICIICGCGADTTKQYVGKWNVYKIASERTDGEENTEIVFDEYTNLDIKFTYESSEDNHYVQHYSILGIENSAYPKNGTFKIEKKSIVLVDDKDGTTATGILKDGTLVIHYTDSEGHGEVLHYLKKISD